jgi:hypothetical protein
VVCRTRFGVAKFTVAVAVAFVGCGGVITFFLFGVVLGTVGKWLDVLLGVGGFGEEGFTDDILFDFVFNHGDI